MKLKRLLLSLTLWLSLTTPSAVRAQASGPEYVVQEGDSLYSIAARFGLTVAGLQAANNLADTTIYVGQVLTIPGFEGIQGRLTTHAAAFGDTLDSLALRYGTSPTSLARLNRIANPQAVFVGEAVVYPQGSAGGLQVKASQLHILQPGETALAVAVRHGVNPWAMLRASNVQLWQALLPGQPLVIPNVGGPPSGLPDVFSLVSPHPLPAETGRTLEISVQTSAEASLSGAFDDIGLHFGQASGAYYALQGVDTLAEPGMHTLSLTATLPSGQAVHFAQRIPVRKVEYGSQILPPVDPSTLDPVVTEPELGHVRSFTARYTPERLWTGLFTLPSAGPTRSPFGVVRVYNDGQLISVHTGADFAGAPGTPILAAADGVVVMTEKLNVRGNATLIDHGWGVYTGYWHQSEINVQVGDRVTAGQEIGLVGATGRVTGPHLHWEVWVGGVPVDPIQWTEVNYP